FQATGVATLAFRAFRIDRNVTYFAGQARGAGPQFPVQNDRATDALADRNVEKIAAAATGANFEFTVSHGISIVFEFEAQASGLHQLGMQLPSSYSRQVTRSQDRISLAINQTRNRNANRFDAVG